LIFVGVDPGSNVTGLAVLQASSAHEKPRLLALDYYESVKTKNFDDKLLDIVEQVSKSLQEFSPDSLALEEAFTGKNIQSALRLAELRGAITYLALKKNISIQHFPTRIVKKSITGNGNASKEQVASYLLNEFDIEAEGVPLDATDALALAYHHYLVWAKKETLQELK
jgi:crossover junction endodeoxyribonuclease RuvC